MLFKDITLLDEELEIREHQYVGVLDDRIAYIGDQMPEKAFGEIYEDRGRLLMSGFYNGHTHSPMTLMRGYGENMALHDWLNDRIFPFEDQLTGEAVYWGTKLAWAESLRFGIVSSTDMYNFCEEIAEATLESGAKNNISRHQVAFTDDDLWDLPCFQEAQRFYRDYREAGDGRVKAELALHAEYTSTPKVVRQLAEYAKATGARIHVHVAETRSEVMKCKERHGQSPVQYLAEMGIFEVPVNAAHCVWLDEVDYDILAESGASVSSCPVSNLKLASGVCHGQELLKRGINVSIGTDSVASNNSLNFVEEMKIFAILNKGIFSDPTAITPKEVLRAATLGGAQMQNRVDCGRLSLGSKADLIVLDIATANMQPIHNLIHNIVYSASGSDVCLTMVDGRVLYKNGEYFTIDLERTIYEVERLTREILRRL